MSSDLRLKSRTELLKFLNLRCKIYKIIFLIYFIFVSSALSRCPGWPRTTSVLKTVVNHCSCFSQHSLTHFFHIAVDAFIKTENSPATNKDEDQDTESLSCLECNVDFIDRYSLNQHLLFHIKQPVVILTPLKTPPIRITLKSTSKDSFEVVSSPLSSPITSPTHCTKLAEQEQEQEQHDETTEGDNTQDAEEANIAFSPNYMNGVESPTVNSENSNSSTMNPMEAEDEQTTNEVEGDEEDYSNIPGAEPTPPPEPSPEYPKIRIKTTGLLRESLTITEITDDNPEGAPTRPEIIELGSRDDATQASSSFGTSQCDEGNMWTTSSLEDPLRIPESSEKDDGNLLSLFSDNNERVKDLGFTSSESEFISLDRLDDRNRTAMVSAITILCG